jgi:hypothetical protein
MDSLQSLHIKNEIFVIDGSTILPLPEWSAALIWLGAWCRKHQFIDKRLIVFAVLPTRELAAAFACVGNLLAGATEYQDTLSWAIFSRLSKGSKVYWYHRGNQRPYSGNVMGIEQHGDSEFIVLHVLKAPRRAEIGSTFKISQRYFDEYRFVEEQPPTALQTCSYHDAARSMCGLLESVNPKWIWADGAEGLIITSMAKFETAIAGLYLKVDGQQPMPFRDLLCLGINGVPVHAKLRISYPKGELSGNFPLAILDGPDAFYIHEHLDHIPNVLVILDRAEYQEGINGTLLQLQNLADENMKNYFDDIPDKFPPGIELAAYAIDRG